MSATGWCWPCSPPPLPERAGAFFRAVWLLPRMSPSVVYALLWSWVVAPTDYGLLNQTLGGAGLPPIDIKSDAPMLLIILANGFIGASFGMIIFTSAIRAIPQHLFHAARVDGAGGLAIVRHITLPAIRWQLSFVTLYQALSLLVSFEYIWLITDGGPFYDTTVYALYVYKRAFDNGQYAYGAALALGLVVVGIAAALAAVALLRHARAAAEAADRGHVSDGRRCRSQRRRSTGQALAGAARRRRRPRRLCSTRSWCSARCRSWCPICGSSRSPSPGGPAPARRALAHAGGADAGARPGLDRCGLALDDRAPAALAAARSCSAPRCWPWPS